MDANLILIQIPLNSIPDHKNHKKEACLSHPGAMGYLSPVCSILGRDLGWGGEPGVAQGQLLQ